MKRLLTPLRQIPEETRTRLLALLGLQALAVLVAVAAAEAARFNLFSAIVALACASSTVASLRFVRVWFDGSPARPAAVPSESPSAPSRGRMKKVLILAMAAGAIGYFGGRGTFAIFTAETSNNSSSVQSGTLVLGNSVNNGSTCYSYSGSTLDNVNNSCTALVSPSNMAPGATVAQAKLVVENDGSLDAGTFYLEAPWPRTTLGTALTSGNLVSTLGLATALNVALANSSQLTVSYQGHSQTFTVSGSFPAGATSITVNSVSANFSYPTGSRVEDISGDTSSSNADCYDQKTTNANWPTSGAAPGTALPFVTTTGNPLCSAVLFWVQEQTNGVNYCWVGRGAVGSGAVATNGQCRTPTTATLSSTLSTGSATTSLAVQALTGNIASGDQIQISESGHTDTFTASADRYIGAATIAVNSQTPTFAYDSSAIVKDKTAFDDMNGDSFNTVANFDTGHRPNAPVQLYPLTANNTAPNTIATVSLGKQGSTGSAGYQRTFYIGVYLPAPSGQAQNQLQGLISTFGLSWHIEQ